MKKKSVVKDTVSAVVILVVLLILTATNGMLSSYALDRLTSYTEIIETGGDHEAAFEAVMMLEKEFYTWRFFFSITINHNNIGEAEEQLIELKEAIKTKDPTVAAIAKSRLIGSFEELRRLSGYGIDSII